MSIPLILGRNFLNVFNIYIYLKPITNLTFNKKYVLLYGTQSFFCALDLNKGIEFKNRLKQLLDVLAYSSNLINMSATNKTAVNDFKNIGFKKDNMENKDNRIGKFCMKLIVMLLTFVI